MAEVVLAVTNRAVMIGTVTCIELTWTISDVQAGGVAPVWVAKDFCFIKLLMLKLICGWLNNYGLHNYMLYYNGSIIIIVIIIIIIIINVNINIIIIIIINNNFFNS